MAVWQTFFNLLLWALIVLLLWPAKKYPYRLTRSRKTWVIFLIFLFFLYAFWGGDYYHYQDLFYGYFNGEYFRLEPVYKWIISNLSFGSYTFFRFIIWGTALLLLLVSYRRCSLKIDLPLFFFGICYVHWFSYARASLSMSIIILGLTMIVSRTKSNNFFIVLLGLALIGVSEYFHRSAVVGIVAAILSLFLINASKKSLFLLLLLTPIVAWLLQYAMQYFMTMDLNYDTYITGRHRDTYFESEQGNILGGGWGERLSIIFTRVPLYFSALMYLKMVHSGKYKELSKTERVLASYTFCLIMLGAFFLLDFGYNTNVLHYRTLIFAMPSNAVFLAIVKNRGGNNKLLNFVFWTTLFGVFYTLIYSVYCAVSVS